MKHYIVLIFWSIAQSNQKEVPETPPGPLDSNSNSDFKILGITLSALKMKKLKCSQLTRFKITKECWLCMVEVKTPFGVVQVDQINYCHHC